MNYVPFQNSSYNPNAVQYQNNPRPLLNLPSAQEVIDDYISPAATWATGQAAQNFATKKIFDNSLGRMAINGGLRVLNSVPAQNAIAGLTALRYGAPIVNSVRNFANSTPGKKIGNAVETAINWIF